jgi:NADH:ubiquinone oxidoreductase subunit K
MPLGLNQCHSNSDIYRITLLSVNLNFICSSVYLDDVLGDIFYFVATAAAESAMGLALLIVLFRIRGDLSTEKRTFGKLTSLIID